MLFNSWIYGAFLALTLAIYWSLPWQRARQWLLAFAGVLFYTYYFPPHVLVIGCFTILIFAATVLAERLTPQSAAGRGRRGLGMHRDPRLLQVPGLPRDSASRSASSVANAWKTDIRAPLAVSFLPSSTSITDRAPPRTIHRADFADFFVFIMFFPTLICGPIKRFNSFHPQIGNVRFSAES